jgi:nucleoside-diphosphate-sugar epimerase
VLLTGASGFVGRHLAARLVRDGAAVSVLVRRPDTPLPDAVAAVPIPATADELAASVEAARPDVCIHLATHFVAAHVPADVAPMLEANVVLGTRLAQALVDAGSVPLIDTGSAWQHVGGDRFRPANLYAATKQALADILTAFSSRHGLPVSRLTLTDTYGPDDPRPKLVPALLRADRTGEPLAMGSGRQLIDLVHVDDCVAAFVRLAARVRRPFGEGAPATTGDGQGGFSVSSGAPLTVRELVERAEEAAGRRLPVRWGARADRTVDAEAPRSPDPRLPGWQPEVGIVDGLRGLFRPRGAAGEPHGVAH